MQKNVLMNGVGKEVKKMNDLIRRGDVLKLFPINDCSDKMIGLYERVLDISTAYDVEKVEEELKITFERTVAEILDMTDSEYTIADFNIKPYSNRICNVVKAGGVNE